MAMAASVTWTGAPTTAVGGADPARVSGRVMDRGLHQAGSLGSGNHFLEVQAVEQIFDRAAAAAFGLADGQLCVMIHCGSRGLGRPIRAGWNG